MIRGSIGFLVLVCFFGVFVVFCFSFDRVRVWVCWFGWVFVCFFCIQLGLNCLQVVIFFVLVTKENSGFNLIGDLVVVVLRRKDVNLELALWLELTYLR